MSAGPLAGRVIAVTRPQHGADDLAERLRVVGAEPYVAPLVRVDTCGDRELQESLARLAVYDWVVFTSVTAVQRVANALSGAVPRREPKTAVVGAATADAVRKLLGWRVHAVPAQFVGDAVVPAMQAHGPLNEARVLWPRAEAARDVVADALAAAGAVVDAPVVYRTIPDASAAAALVRRIEAGGVDAVTFTSPSAVAAYAAAGVPRSDVVVAVIGPVTASACSERGISVQIVPREHTIAALVDALVMHMKREA